MPLKKTHQGQMRIRRLGARFSSHFVPLKKTHRGQGAFEYVLLLGSVLFLVLFAIVILKGTGPEGIGFQINKSLREAEPFLNASAINETPFIPITPPVITPPPTPTPTPTATPLPPAQLVSSCRAITFPGHYRLSRDLNSSGTCLSIIASDVVLDCAGHWIRGNGSAASNGIYGVASTNIVAKNCLITNYSTGVYFDSCSFCGAENISSTNSGNGIWFRNSPNSRVVNAVAASDSTGILFQHSSHFNITGNSAGNNSEGIRVESSSYGVLDSNNASDNSGSGFHVYDSNNNSIARNQAFRNRAGFYFAGYANYNNLSSNNASFNYERGFFFAPSAGNNLAKNTACSNPTNLYCVMPQVDGGNNTCGATGPEFACASSVWCGQCP